MKKLALIFTVLLMALSIPIQASAASLYEVRQALKNYYYGEVNGDIYDAQSIDELMQMIKDPYTVYFTSEEYRQFFQSIEQETVGIGVVVETHIQGIYISDVLANGPASTAGLKSGDIITHADGVSLVGISLSEAVGYITGDVNTSVTLTILRNDGSSNTVNLVRKTIQSPNTVSSLLYGNVGYIHLASFSEKAAEEVSNAIGNLKKQGATKFIFDLQNNGGGYVATAIDIISLFPNAKNAFVLHDVDGVTTYSVKQNMSYKARSYYKFPTDVSLLINGASASASDMTAGAIKDQKLGTIYGSTSYGKGLMQRIEPFRDGSALKVTTAEFRTPNGNVINEVGIKPDVETRTPIEAAHFDFIKSQLTKFKQLKALQNVPQNKTFTISLTKDVDAKSVANAIELVKLGGSSIDITTKVVGSKISVTPKQALTAQSQYVLVVHPTIKNTQGKALKTGRFMHITVAK